MPKIYKCYSNEFFLQASYEYVTGSAVINNRTNQLQCVSFKAISQISNLHEMNNNTIITITHY